MSKEAKIGLIVLLAIVGGVWGLNYLKGVNMFHSQEAYYSIYENTGGLTVSAAVIYQGNKVGRVKHIRLLTDSTGVNSAKWFVEFTIDNKELIVPDNSIAKIGGSVLSSKVIDLVLGDSPIRATEGDTLAGATQEDITETFSREIEPLKKSIETLVGSVDGVVTNVNAIFMDDATQGLPKVFESLQRSMTTLETTFIRVDGMIAENRAKLGSIIDNVEQITGTFNENSGALDTIITNFSNISDSLAQIEFATIMTKASTTMAEMAQITEKINNGDGTLSQILNSDSLIIEIEQTNQELQYLLNDIYTNPKKYLGFSVIGRKDRNGFSAKEEDRIKEIIKEEK